MNILESSKQARADIDSCYSYIKDNLQEPYVALDLLLSIDKKVKQLVFLPEAWPLVNNDFLASKGYRAVTVKRYTLFYRFEAESSVIRLLRFLPGRMNWARILLKDFEEEEG
ncbi:MAG: type II toxin-antitoxin system RelE/ParE family toxin [Candidatus Cloacimonetes bacterium]|nr:type II toxin-antitoxin system RelE/ParE family toxin [Candidatus Cloacimonadota bacterium]